MTLSAFRELADRAGILPSYTGADERVYTASDDVQRGLLRALGVDPDTGNGALERESWPALAQIVRPARAFTWRAPRRLGAGEVELCCEAGGGLRQSFAAGRSLQLPPLPAGVHRLWITARGERRCQHLLAAPARCVAPRAVRRAGLWLNLYALRGPTGFGVGHLGDLRRLVSWAAGAGMEFVGLNPLHACRNAAPDVSPYAGTTRLFRNRLYLDVAAVPELAGCAAARAVLARRPAAARAAALRRAEHIDYGAAAAAQHAVLEALHPAFLRSRAGSVAFAAFCARDGGLAVDYATFEALRSEAERRGHGPDWRLWPEEWRSPASHAVQRFRRDHGRAVAFELFVQFELERQLEEVAGAARAAGMELGLYQDLALGAAPDGFDTWAFADSFAAGVTIGAPPDAYCAEGQDWGLPPLHPRRLLESGLCYWRLVVRNALRGAGALRIDHAMGMLRQYWIPAGRPPRQGAYVRFPFDEMMAVLAIESHAAGAAVIGEDLGTVPEGFSAALHKRGVLSSRVLLFERDAAGEFRPPDDYPRRALVTANTHDHPTLSAWWHGSDLELRRRIGVIETEAELARLRALRRDDVEALARLLAAEGLLERTADAAAVCRAVYALLGRTPALLLGISLDDLTGETEPVNLPGVPWRRYPSWTRRMRVEFEDLLADRGLTATLRELGRRR